MGEGAGTRPEKLEESGVNMNRRQPHEALTQLLERFVKNGPPGCALKVTRRGETWYEHYAGYADVDTRTPIGKDTIYRIYSMSKVITCAAALLLYERGHFLLNDPLDEYLPEFRSAEVYRRLPDGSRVREPANRRILVKDLFTMTSGITYNGDDCDTSRAVQAALAELRRGTQRFDARALSKLIASVPLAFEPGTRWRYGFNHDVLGALIEEVSGKPFGAFLQDEIFGPLRMRDTFFRLPEEKKNRLCTMYGRSADGALSPKRDMDEAYSPEATFESGGGGLLSTIDDYERFAQMLLNGGELDGVRILGRKTIELMATNHLNAEQLADFRWPSMAGYGYGLGVRVMIDPPAGGCNGSVGEYGWQGLAGSWTFIDPKEQMVAVYMQQMIPSLEPELHPRLRAAIYATL